MGAPGPRARDAAGPLLIGTWRITRREVAAVRTRFPAPPPRARGRAAAAQAPLSALPAGESPRSLGFGWSRAGGVSARRSAHAARRAPSGAAIVERGPARPCSSPAASVRAGPDSDRGAPQRPPGTTAVRAPVPAAPTERAPARPPLLWAGRGASFRRAQARACECRAGRTRRRPDPAGAGAPPHERPGRPDPAGAGAPRKGPPRRPKPAGDTQRLGLTSARRAPAGRPRAPAARRPSRRRDG